MKSLSGVQLFETPWTVAHQAPLSMGFSRQEYWSGLPFPSMRIFLTQGLNPGLPHCRQILYRLSHQGSPRGIGGACKEWGTQRPPCPGVPQGPILHQDRELVLKTLSPQQDGWTLELRVHASSQKGQRDLLHKGGVLDNMLQHSSHVQK